LEIWSKTKMTKAGVPTVLASPASGWPRREQENGGRSADGRGQEHQHDGILLQGEEVWEAVRKRLVLDRAGSASCFRAAVSSEEVPHGKPVGRRGWDVGCGLVNPATRHRPNSSNGEPGPDRPAPAQLGHHWPTSSER
jgi:hypothetical protein